MSIPIGVPAAEAQRELDACNEISGRFGLALTDRQMLNLTRRRQEALKATGRVEFGQGVLTKLVAAFRDSPYIMQRNYEETLAELQDIFYYFKNESLDILTDDELIEAMKLLFDGKAHGSTDYLAGTALEELCYILRGGEDEEPEEPYDE